MVGEVHENLRSARAQFWNRFAALEGLVPRANPHGERATVTPGSLYASPSLKVVFDATFDGTLHGATRPTDVAPQRPNGRIQMTSRPRGR